MALERDSWCVNKWYPLFQNNSPILPTSPFLWKNLNPSVFRKISNSKPNLPFIKQGGSNYVHFSSRDQGILTYFTYFFSFCFYFEQVNICWAELFKHIFNALPFLICSSILKILVFLLFRSANRAFSAICIYSIYFILSLFGQAFCITFFCPIESFSIKKRPFNSFMQSKSMDWFLYGRDIRHERIKGIPKAILAFGGSFSSIDISMIRTYFASESLQ